MLTATPFKALVSRVITTLCCSALADPTDIAVLIDNSTDMQRADSGNRVGKALRTYLDGMGSDNRASFFIYGSDTLLIRPLDEISDAVLPFADRLNKTLNYSSQTSNAAAGLERAIHELTHTGHSDKRRVLIWISGSEINTGDPEQD